MALKVLKLIRGNEIIRRYVIMNSFDGALTILGIVLATFLGGLRDPSLIILPSIGAAVAMAISGMSGAYAAEVAEVKHSTREMERHLQRNLSGTKVVKAKEKMALLIAFFDGISPLIVALAVITPFFLVAPGIISMQLAYYLTIGFISLVLIILGVFAARIAHEPVWKHALRMLSAGVITGIVFYLLVLVGIL